MVEDAGLEVDSMAESTSQLQAKLKALTHGKVDIMIDTDTFENTTQILREMSQAWQDMTDIERSAALELMGGKRQANILASIITNFQTVEDVIQTSMDSAGSAYAENAKWMDSIEGKTKTLKNSMETLWMNTLNSKAVKFFLDIANGIVKVVEKVGLLKTALGALLAISILKAEPNSWLSIFEVFTTKGVNHGSLIYQILNGALTNGLSGIIAAFKTTGLAANAAALGVKVLNAALAMGAVAIAGIVITKAVEFFYNLAHASEQAAERIQNATSTYQDAQKTLANQKSTVDELSKKYTELSVGVDPLTNTNIGLTTESYKEYLKVCNDIADIYPELVAGYDAQGNAILTLKGKVDGLVQSYKNAQEAAALEFLTPQNKKDAWDVYKSKASKYDDKWITGLSGSKEDQQKVLEALTTMGSEDFSKFYSSSSLGKVGNWNYLRSQLKKNGTYVDDTTMYRAYNSMSTKFDYSSLENYRASVNEKLSQINQDIADGMSGIRETLSASLVFDNTYQKLDIEGQNVVKAILNNLDPYMIEQSGANNIDEFITWFSSNIISGLEDTESKLDNIDILKKLNTLSTDVTKAIVGNDQKAFETVQSEFDALLTDWLGTTDLNINPNDDAITKYLKNLALNIQEQSKNYEVRLQFKTDIANSVNSTQDQIKYKEVITDEIKQKREEAQNLVDEYYRALERYKAKRSKPQKKTTSEADNLTKDEYVTLFSSIAKNYGGTLESNILLTPILQTDDGEMRFDKKFVANYSQALLEELQRTKGTWNLNDLIELDEQGLELSGKKVRKAFTGIDQEVIQAAQDIALEANKTGEEISSVASESEQALSSDNNGDKVAAAWKKIEEAADKAGMEAQQYVDIINSGNWDKLGLGGKMVPEFSDQPTASELLDGKTAENYIKQAKKMSKSSDELAKANAVMVKSLAGEDGVLFSSEIKDMYDQWVEAGNQAPEGSEWTQDQIASMQILDALMQEYNMDINSISQSLIDMGYILPSLDDIASFDLSTSTTQDAINKFEESIASIKDAWNSLNDGDMTKSDFIKLAMDFPEIMEGIDFTDDNWMVRAKENLEELNNTKISNFLDNLEQIKVAMQERGEDTAYLEAYIDYVKEIQSMPLLDVESKTKANTVAGLTEEYDNYKSIMEETNKVLYNGQKVSSDYYDSLKEYITDTNTLSKCFDKNNKRIVTNVNLLKRLIVQQKQENLNTVRNAKAQTLLQYGKIVQQLIKATNAYEDNTKAGFNEIDSLMGQINTLEDAIDQYKNLELALLGATNAFDEFEKAKQIDSETDYQSPLEEMIDALTEGFDSGNVGTEAFNAAIKGLFTPDLYGEAIDSVEDLDNIWAKYSKGFLSSKNEVNAFGSFFTRTDDGIEVTEKNMRNFVAAAQKMGVLTGDSFDEFDVTAGTSLEKFAEKMGMTKDMVYAFLDMLSNRTIGAEKLTSQLADVAADKKIEDTTKALKEATEAKIELLRSGDYDPKDLENANKNIKEAQDAYDKAIQGAKDYATQYTTLASIQAAFEDELDLSKDELNSLAGALSEVTGQKYYISADGSQLLDAEGKVVDIQAMLQKLGAKPTELQLQLRYEEITQQIDKIQEKIDLLKSNPSYAKSIGLYDEASVQAEIDRLEADLQEKLANRKVLEVLYGFKPANDEETQGLMEQIGELQENGVTAPFYANTTEFNAKVDEARENAEKPIETTLTVNTVTGKTDVTTTGTNGATVDFHVGGGYQEVLDKLAYLTAQCKIPIEQKVDVSDNDTIKEVKDQLIDLQNTNVDDKSFNIEMTGYDTVVSQLQTIMDDLASINGMTASATVTVNTVTTESTTGNQVGGPTKYANGTAHAQGNWGAPKTETALTGELGPEMIVRGNEWFTVGENGPEFAEIQRGDIIFNHKQTKELLKNGYVASRGQIVGGGDAFAEGTAYAKTYTKHYNFTGKQNTATTTANTLYNTAKDAADSVTDAADEVTDDIEEVVNDFKDTIDWIEIRLQKIDDILNLLQAKLDNAVGYENQNNIIDQMMSTHQSKLANLKAGLDAYASYAAKLLGDIPEQYREAAQNGAIAIESFAGDAGEAAVDAINEYRTWADKVTDLTQQIEELSKTIEDLANQKLDNIINQFENLIGLTSGTTDKFEALISLMEARGYVATKQYYSELILNLRVQSSKLKAEHDRLQEELDRQIEAGNIQVKSDVWYEKIQELNDLDLELLNIEQEIQENLKAVNQIVWDNFDQLLNRIEYISDDAENLIDKLSHQDFIQNDGTWAKASTETLKAYATQMASAQFTANQYSIALEQLERDYKAGCYSQIEYLEKLNELKNGQADAIEKVYQMKEAINNLTWNNFDEIINRIDYIKDETSNLIQLLSHSDLVAKPVERTYEGTTEKYWTKDDVQWTKEGQATLALYAKQMKIADTRAKQYAVAIRSLNKMYEDGKYTETEYLAKLNELKSAQYDSIEAYYDARDAIQDLNKTRVDSIKEGIEKEIDAYEELINKKKEALDADKDMHDFQKTVADKQKSIADIQRKLSALATDTSISAAAQRKKLQAELIEAQSDLDEIYYDRSMSNKQDALDKELEDFQDEKDKELEKWDKYLEDVEKIVEDSLAVVKENATDVYDTLEDKSTQYHLQLSEQITSPWNQGLSAIYTYQNAFDTAMKSAMQQLKAQQAEWKELIRLMEQKAQTEIKNQYDHNKTHTSAQNPAPQTSETPSNSGNAVGAGMVINAAGKTIYAASDGSGAGTQYYADDPIYIVLGENNGYLKVRHKSLTSGVTGWFKKSDVLPYYAKGTLGVENNQLAWLDELGEELVLNAGPDGRLQYLTKGTSVIPSDLTENLMKLGQLDPQDILDRNRPVISAPHITNNNIELKLEVGEVVHIDTVTNDTLPDLTKTIDKQLDNYMKQLNGKIRRYVR